MQRPIYNYKQKHCNQCAPLQNKKKNFPSIPHRNIAVLYISQNTNSNRKIFANIFQVFKLGLQYKFLAPINQSINQRIEQSINQSIEQSNNQLQLGTRWEMVGASAAIATTTQLALTLTSFRLIWNVPSQACQKDFGIALPLSPYGIEENVGQEFVGETIALFYNLGEFPRLIKEANGSYTSVNGGIPQLANLSAHLESILHDLSSSLPENFSGLWVFP